jgi:hypothetical protein
MTHTGPKTFLPRWSYLIALFSIYSVLLPTKTKAQNQAKWEFSGNIQANHARIRNNATFINPQNQQLRYDETKQFNTSLDFELIRVQNDVWQHGLRAGGIILGGGDIVDLVGPSANLFPPVINAANLGLRYFQLGYQLRINPIAACEKYLLKTQTTKQRLKLYFTLGTGALLDLGDNDRPLYEMEWFPVYFTTPNGQPGMVNKDFYEQAHINAYVSAELQLAFQVSKYISVRFGINKLLPIGKALFETRNEYYLNNQTITYSSTDGAGPHSAARIGIAYHFNQFPFIKNKNKK